jgi:SAM-dependent methyltransferase
LSLELIPVRKLLKLLKNIIKKGKLKNLTFLVCDATKISIKDVGNHFDGAVCSEVIEHINNWEKALHFCAKVVKTDGYLILTFPNDPKQWSVLDDYASHVQCFEIDTIEKMLILNDFVPVRTMTIGFPFMRLIVFLYDNYIKISRRPHDLDIFSDSYLYKYIYKSLVFMILRIDSIFNVYKKGTTAIIVTRKMLSKI